MGESQSAEGKAAIPIEDLMADAVAKKASDIHLVAGQAPIMRIHGDMVAVEGMPIMAPAHTAAIGQQLTNKEQWERFVAERDLDFSISRPGLARFRANLYWQRDSVALALRLIPEHIATFAELGLPKQLEKFAMMEHGLFLVTGPTGSGKSTTLAAMVDWINERRSCNIITIEDPIEFLHRHKRALISQREMNQDTRSFGQALRRVLRQDPDVILVGELRDLESIEMAMTLAETGHLVLSTLHTTDATQTTNRIVDSYPPQQQTLARSQLSFVLAGIMAQGLMRRRDAAGARDGDGTPRRDAGGAKPHPDGRDSAALCRHGERQRRGHDHAQRLSALPVSPRAYLAGGRDPAEHAAEGTDRAALRSLSARCGRFAGDAPAGSFVGGRLCAGMRRAQDGL